VTAGKGNEVSNFAVTSTPGGSYRDQPLPTAAQEEWPMAQTYAAQRAEIHMGIKTTALLIGRHGKLGVE
jgi:hypothetical protein